ncbi:MAG TPA: hypothetical protein VNZ02_08635 [Steroidobacteraceae bacterium]|jgi:hypothetical protein|nr:hypothetical protein [Steroidobacteraceae bacterium]
MSDELTATFERHMQLRFICGENATYASLIASDHGAPYAKSLRLPCSGVSSLSEPASGSEAVIIDDNLTEDEARLVRKFVERQQAPVLLKVVDPYWVRGNHGRRKTTYSALVETYCRLPNVAILSPYEPSEWLRMVVDKFHPKLLVLPYPYVAEAERPLDFEGFSARLDRAVLTGALSGRKYPRRAMVHRLRHILPGYRRNFDLLPHPGYPNLGEPLRHNLIFDNFVKFIGGYKYFFVDPSRADLEFLKFTECAYAGCVPVGQPAASLPEAARRLVLETSKFLKLMRKPAAVRDPVHFEAALAYRAVMSKSRKSEELRQRLEDFVQSNF